MVKYLLLAALANLAVASEIQASPNQIQFPNQWECRQKGMETYAWGETDTYRAVICGNYSQPLVYQGSMMNPASSITLPVKQVHPCAFVAKNGNYENFLTLMESESSISVWKNGERIDVEGINQSSACHY